MVNLIIFGCGGCIGLWFWRSYLPYNIVIMCTLKLQVMGWILLLSTENRWLWGPKWVSQSQLRARNFDALVWLNESTYLLKGPISACIDCYLWNPGRRQLSHALLGSFLPLKFSSTFLIALKSLGVLKKYVEGGLN